MRICRLLLWLGLIGWLAESHAADLIPDRDCLECHSDKEISKTNAAGATIMLYVDEARLRASVHGTNNCAACHSDITRAHPDDEVAAKPVDCTGCHTVASESYDHGVHAQALQRGEDGAARCADCHGTHDILSYRSPQSALHRNNLATTCGQCHEAEARELAESVHGQALARGLREPPTCTDCHAEHSVQALKGASTLRVAEKVCSHCHASERMNTKYRLPPDRVSTFFKSYHGLAVQFGDTRAANCASCHGYHRILPSSDPRSSTHPDNLVKTCGECHPGATENFVAGRIHADDLNGGDIGSLVNRWTRRIYLVLIVATVALMGAHNLLLWRRKVLAYVRSPDRSVVRMDRSQRIQHLVLMLTFFFLAITGFALEYPHSWLAKLFGSDESIRRWCHRIAGLVLLGAGAYHIYYVATTQAGRRLIRDLWPRRQDLTDLSQGLKHLVDPQAPKPKFGRFGYTEKVEYWAVIWGTIIMGVTGLALWFKLPVTQFLPRWVVDVASTVHFYEAILAILAIAIWHFYHVIFDPEVYPGNLAWWDGRVSSHWYAEEHPLDPINAPTAANQNGPGSPAEPSPPGAVHGPAPRHPQNP
jgi:formate dehydrogenase gamma subunit